MVYDKDENDSLIASLRIKANELSETLGQIGVCIRNLEEIKDVYDSAIDPEDPTKRIRVLKAPQDNGTGKSISVSRRNEVFDENKTTAQTFLA